MKDKYIIKSNVRKRRKKHIKKKVCGTKERPRLVVYRSLNHIYAQLIDDSKGVTICEASSISKEFKDKFKKVNGKFEKSTFVGKAIADKAKKKKLKKIVFDRNGYLYHGRIKAVADAARDNGLDF